MEAGLVMASAAAGPLLLADASNSNINSLKPGSNVMRARMRGLMVDAGRVPETVAYYKRVIEFCADWELNTLQFRLTDDQGSAMRFTSVPDLVTHNNAFTVDQLVSLAEYGRSHGVDLIPELESFGHTGYITRSPSYTHLLDQDTTGSKEFTGIIPVSPESLQLFGKLYREVAEIFPSIYLHGGCDEVNWGGSLLSRKALRTKTRVQIWAEYLNALNQIAAGLGKQFIVWGDIVLHKEPAILALLSKNIIIMDWNYEGTSSTKFHETLQQVSTNGSRAIGAPALTHSKWGARVGSDQLRNIDAFADAYLQTNESQSLGVILTNWVPSRYLQNSIWDGFAYAAVAFNEGTSIARTNGFRRFVEKHYGAKWNDIWSEVFASIYDAAPPTRDQETPAPKALYLPVPWSNDEQLAAILRRKLTRTNPFTHIRGLLVNLEPFVMKKFPDFQAFELCVEYLEQTFWREAVVIEQAAKVPLQRDATDLLIQIIAERDRDLAGALTADWDTGRFPNSSAKLEPVFDLMPKDQLLFQWKRAAAYSASLASHPDRFYQLIQTSETKS